MSRHDAVARIDKDIEELESLIIELKRKRNSLVHICRLPNELLVFIISFLQVKSNPLYSQTIGFYPFDDYSISWVNMT
jgi:hypothetical protein